MPVHTFITFKLQHNQKKVSRSKSPEYDNWMTPAHPSSLLTSPDDTYSTIASMRPADSEIIFLLEQQ